ncbi:MAG: hypothetical protein ACOX4Q_12790 [Syntrophomonadales bacterium]|jgi:chaperonin cofactor prefoldin
MTDETNPTDNVIRLTTPEFMFFIQRVDLVDSKLTTRIDAVENKLTTRIDAVESKLTARIDAVESKLTARIDAVENKLTAIESRLTDRIDAVQNDLRQEFRQEFGSVKTLIWATLGLMVAVIGIAITVAATIL